MDIGANMQATHQAARLVRERLARRERLAGRAGTAAFAEAARKDIR